MASSIVRYLQASAQRLPGRTAVRAGGRAVSYAELWRQVVTVAAGLRARGLEPGDRVALILENSVECIAAIYGALLAGGIVVPLNAAAKARDFNTWLGHCAARLLFAAPDNAEAHEACLALPAPPVRLDLNEMLAAAAPPDPSAAGVSVEFDAKQPATIQYTSGTTGSPKGVLLSHGNLAANTAAIVEYLQLTEQDSIVNVLPFYYAYGSSVLHTHLAAGAELILADNVIYPHLVVEALARHRATGFAGVPSTFLLMLARGRLADYDLSGLRYVTQAGGAMPPAVTSRLRAALPHVQIAIMYGQTEATARISWLPPKRLGDKPGSVGVAIPGVSLQVRQENGGIAATGESGEVWVQGPNVMLGYWQNIEATRAVLKDSWLRTGDMGYLDAEGFLYLSGRRSDMIKTGAHRVHPQDIEDVIMEIAGVADVAVVAMEDEVLGEAVRAIVVPAAGATLDALRIKAHCRARLANYKVPKAVEFRADLPRTASGKVRRNELRERTTQP